MQTPDIERAKTVEPPVPDIAAMTRSMKAGNEMAYRTFYSAYAGRLARYLLVVCAGDEQRMRDALQETLRRVVRHIRVFELEAVFWSWLTVLARTSAVDERRSLIRYAGLLDRFQRHQPVDANSTVDADRALLDSLEESLSELAPMDRELVTLKYHEQVPVRAIALQLNTTESAIESRLVRIRQKLRARLSTLLKHHER